MDMDWQHYHRLNVTLLSMLGLWPYGNKLVLLFKRLCGCFVTICTCLAQLTTFFTVDYTRGLILQNVPCMLMSCGILSKYISFLFASDSIKKLTDTINGDWKKIACKEESQIMHKYVEKGKFHTMGFSMFICPAVASLLLFPLYSEVLDIVIPLNESRKHNFPIMYDIFIDQDKYFLIASFFYNGGVLMGGFVIVSTEALLIVYIQHARALFEVTSRRIKKLLRAPVTKDSKRSCNVVVIRQLVDIHRRAIRHCKTIRDDFLQTYTILIILGILCLGAHLFHCTESFASQKFTECFTSAVFCLGILGYIFYVNFVSQNVIDSSAGIFDVLYETEWCNFPTSTRKLILFFMLNTIRPVSIDVYSIFVPSYEGFSMIVRMTMSFVTALYSLH